MDTLCRNHLYQNAQTRHEVVIVFPVLVLGSVSWVTFLFSDVHTSDNRVGRTDRENMIHRLLDRVQWCMRSQNRRRQPVLYQVEWRLRQADSSL